MKHPLILSHIVIALQSLTTTAIPITQDDIDITNTTTQTNSRARSWLDTFSIGVNNIASEDPDAKPLLLQLDSALFPQSHIIRSEIQTPSTGELTFSILSPLGSRAHTSLRDGRWSPTTFSTPKSQNILRPVRWPPKLPVADALTLLLENGYQATFNQYTLNWHGVAVGQFGRVDMPCWNFIWYFAGWRSVMVVQVGMDKRVSRAQSSVSEGVGLVDDGVGEGQIS